MGSNWVIRRLRIYRLAMANAHFFEPQFIVNFVPESKIWRGRIFVRCADVIQYSQQIYITDYEILLQIYLTKKLP